MDYRQSELKEHLHILKQLSERRNRCIKGGTICSIVSGTLCLMFGIIGIAISNSVVSAFSIVFLSASICGAIGAARNRKERILYEKREYKMKTGFVAAVRKRNSWSEVVDIVYSDKSVATFSQIGHRFKPNERVYVVLVDEMQARWALPRIVREV